MDLMLQGMERMTGQTNWATGSSGRAGDGGRASATTGSSGRSSSWSAGSTAGQAQASAGASSGDDQDLSRDDLKYVLWSILFCKPGYEAVLEPQQGDLVNYSAEGASYAAVKIAKYLEKARHGRTERPQLWTEKGDPVDSGPVPPLGVAQHRRRQRSRRASAGGASRRRTTSTSSSCTGWSAGCPGRSPTSPASNA